MGRGKEGRWAAAWFPGSGFLLSFFSVISKPFSNQFETILNFGQITHHNKYEFPA